jgi:hypothetical protein
MMSVFERRAGLVKMKVKKREPERVQATSKRIMKGGVYLSSLQPLLFCQRTACMTGIHRIAKWNVDPYH